MTYTSIHNSQKMIFDRKPFTGNSMMGTTNLVGTGRLSDIETALYRGNSDVIDYTVLSYATPIAWHYSDGRDLPWHLVGKSFSRATSRHQSAVRYALNLDLAEQRCFDCGRIRAWNDLDWKSTGSVRVCKAQWCK